MLVRCLAVLVLASLAVADQTWLFQQVGAQVPNDIGIDYSPFLNSVVVSANYPSGHPNNFYSLTLGNFVPFSTVNSLTDEIKITIVPEDAIGGWIPGTLYVGTGGNAEIGRISRDGSTITDPWVTLPGCGSNCLIRGSIAFDNVGTFGGDMLVVTTNAKVYRVTVAGVATLLASFNSHLEGALVVPNNAALYGPLAGTLIAGAEEVSKLVVVDNAGTLTTYNVRPRIEDLDLIRPFRRFYGCNYGSGKILSVDDSFLRPHAGKILVTTESRGNDPVAGHSGLYLLTWDGAAPAFESVFPDPAGLQPAQWEHVTLAPVQLVICLPGDPTCTDPNENCLIECNDNDPCTRDVCEHGVCVHHPVTFCDNRCRECGQCRFDWQCQSGLCLHTGGAEWGVCSTSFQLPPTCRPCPGHFARNCLGECPDSCATCRNCERSHYCAGGACVPRRPAGTRCTGNAQCQSDTCVVGICA